jgi:hypothetical protein
VQALKTVLPKIGDIIENAILINTSVENQTNGIFLLGMARDDTSYYPTLMNVLRKKDNNLEINGIDVYTLKSTSSRKIEPRAIYSASGRNNPKPLSTLSELTIKEVLEIVKEANPYIVPEVVYGKDRPQSHSFRNLLHSVDDIDEKPRFGMDSQVEATKNLVAVHNITSDKLEKMFEYEGLPMPSIAITKADIGHENFGGISLVFRKETIDPKNKKNKVYSADAWTPTFPQIEYEVNDEVQSRLNSKFYELSRKYGREAADALYKYGVTLEDTLNRAGGVNNIIQEEQKNPRMAEAFLYDMGKGEEIPQVKTIETETGRKPIDKNTRALAEYIIDDIGRDRLEAGNLKTKDYMMSVAKRMVSEFGLDSDEAMAKARKQGFGYYVNLSKTVRALLRGEDEIVTRETKTDASERNAYLQETLQSPEYKEWLHDLFDGMEQSKGIYNGKERFTRLGNRKSFKQTHYDVTAENIVRAMLNEGNGNAQNTAGFIAGIKSVRSSAAQKFSSIEDIKAASNSLQTTDTNTYNQKLDELNTRLAKAIDQVRQDPNSFMESDSIGEILIEGIEKKMTSPAALKKLYEGYRYDLSDEAAQEFSDIIKETRELPVNMFEAKPERVVAWDEIAMAILPTDVDQAIPDGLEQRGVEDIRYYVAGNEEDRLRILNDNDDVRFSKETPIVSAPHSKAAVMRLANP